MEKIQYVVHECHRTKDNLQNLAAEECICFIQSSGMGKTKLIQEFAKLTRLEERIRYVVVVVVVFKVELPVTSRLNVYVSICCCCGPGGYC
jgi:energy-coupling factor transporter ATP-binding protein EcfA2